MSPSFRLLNAMARNGSIEECASILREFCESRYGVYITESESYEILSAINICHHVTLESVSMLETHVRRWIERLEISDFQVKDPQPIPRLVYNRLTMGWGSKAFEDAKPVLPAPSRSKVFRKMPNENLEPIDLLTALVAGNA